MIVDSIRSQLDIDLFCANGLDDRLGAIDGLKLLSRFLDAPINGRFADLQDNGYIPRGFTRGNPSQGFTLPL